MGLFNKFFGKFIKNVSSFSKLKLMNGWSPTFTSFGDEIYRSQVTRSCIHSIANNAAKFSAVHITTKDGKVIPAPDTVFQRMIGLRPNPIMSAFDFYYKMITILENKNNSFSLIERDFLTGQATMLIPIAYSSVEAVEFQNEIFMKFVLNNGNTLVVPYMDLIHLRKFYYDKDLFGEDNAALLPTITLLHTVNEGIDNAIKSSATLRGILSANGIMNPDDMRQQRTDFVTDYLGSENNGGIAVTDSKMTFTPLDSDPTLVNKDQMEAIKNEVYDYFNINQNIIQCSYNEDQWNAFYESKLEPFAIQMSEEFSYKIFTERQRGHGNKIIFSSNKLAYASNKTKIQMVKEVGILGAMTINEIREIFNMGPVADGEKRVQTLNVIDASIANKHQSGGGEEDE